MSEGLSGVGAEDLASAESGVPKVEIESPLFAAGTFTIAPEFLAELSERTGLQFLTVTGGSAAKNILRSADGSRICLIAQSLDGAKFEQVSQQVRLYEQLNSEALFRDLVVPLEQVIAISENGRIREVGMVQQIWGEAIEPHTKIPQESVEAFQEKYRKFIEKHKIPHGDLTSLEHIRFDPKTKALKFIDFHGNRGIINSPSGNILPENRLAYQNALKREPVMLYGLLKSNIVPAPKGAIAARLKGIRPV